MNCLIQKRFVLVFAGFWWTIYWASRLWGNKKHWDWVKFIHRSIGAHTISIFTTFNLILVLGLSMTFPGAVNRVDGWYFIKFFIGNNFFDLNLFDFVTNSLKIWIKQISNLDRLVFGFQIIFLLSYPFNNILNLGYFILNLLLKFSNTRTTNSNKHNLLINNLTILNILNYLFIFLNITIYFLLYF